MRPVVVTSSHCTLDSSGKSGAYWHHRKTVKPAPLIRRRAFALSCQEFGLPVSMYPTWHAAFSSNLTCRANHPHDVIINEIALNVQSPQPDHPPAGFCLSLTFLIGR